MKLKVLIVEPSQIIIEGLQSMLRDCQQLEVVGVAEDVSMLEERMASRHPDVVIINPSLLPYSSQAPASVSLPDETFSVALVYQSFDWNHGVYVGSAMASETTAAAAGA